MQNEIISEMKSEVKLQKRAAVPEVRVGGAWAWQGSNPLCPTKGPDTSGEPGHITEQD